MISCLVDVKPLKIDDIGANDSSIKVRVEEELMR